VWRQRFGEGDLTRDGSNGPKDQNGRAKAGSCRNMIGKEACSVYKVGFRAMNSIDRGTLASPRFELQSISVVRNGGVLTRVICGRGQTFDANKWSHGHGLSLWRQGSIQHSAP
jgi:hypothetical protein